MRVMVKADGKKVLLPAGGRFFIQKPLRYYARLDDLANCQAVVAQHPIDNVLTTGFNHTSIPASP
jgi:hypothetical protein